MITQRVRPTPAVIQHRVRADDGVEYAIDSRQRLLYRDEGGVWYTLPGLDPRCARAVHALFCSERET